MNIERSKTISVFYCYAPEDKKWLKELKKHLASMRRYESLKDWDESEIFPGEEVKKEINVYLNNVDIVLILLSANFLNSDSCFNLMEQCLELHNNGILQVIPLYVRSCDLPKNAVFQGLQMFPKNGKPVAEWKNRDQAFKEIVEGVRNIAKETSASHHIHISLENLPEIHPRRVLESSHPSNPESSLMLETDREEPLNALKTKIPHQKPRRIFLRFIGAGILGSSILGLAYLTWSRSLPLGAWEINAGGTYKGMLNLAFQNDNKILGDVFGDPLILAFQNDNKILGDVFGDPLIGSWNPNSKKIFFLRVDQTDFSSFQVYSGTVDNNNTIQGTAISYDREKLLASFPFAWFARYKSPSSINSINMPGPTWQKFQNWKIQIDDGQSGILNILNLDNSLVISGNVFNNPLIGYWDEQIEISKIIFFSSLSQDISSFQIYQGTFQNNMLKGNLKKYTASSAIQFSEQADWQAHP